MSKLPENLRIYGFRDPMWRIVCEQRTRDLILGAFGILGTLIGCGILWQLIP